eukprot:6177717-Pleurochrysis_carterae.AAC.1
MRVWIGLAARLFELRILRDKSRLYTSTAKGACERTRGESGACTLASAQRGCERQKCDARRREAAGVILRRAGNCGATIEEIAAAAAVVASKCEPAVHASGSAVAARRGMR